MSSATIVMSEQCKLKNWLGVIVSLVFLSPYPICAQSYDLTVGTERHFNFFRIDPLPIGDEFTPYGIERVIDEVIIENTTWAEVEWHYWIQYHNQPDGPFLVEGRDTSLYRSAGSKLFEYTEGEEKVIFDFHVAPGDSIFNELEPYILSGIISGYISSFSSHLNEYGAISLLDTLWKMDNGRTARLIWGDNPEVAKKITGKLFVDEILSYDNGLPTAFNPDFVEIYPTYSPYLFVEGLGSLFTIFTHRGLQLTGYKSSEGVEYGSFNSVPTSVSEQAILPDKIMLLPNYPNPFNPSTLIGYELPESAHVRLSVYDLLGREVAVLVNEITSAGRHQAVFNGQNLSSGIYVYRLQSSEQLLTGKMLLMK